MPESSQQPSLGAEGFFPKPIEGAERDLFEKQFNGWTPHPQNLLPVGLPAPGCGLGPSPGVSQRGAEGDLRAFVLQIFAGN